MIEKWVDENQEFDNLIKQMMQVKAGDIIICYDNYLHDYDEHDFLVESIEKDNENGIIFYGKDLTYDIDEEMSLGRVGLENFVRKKVCTMKIVQGDIFESKADAILHQVNCQGVMGSGVAKQVREKYPVVYQWYKLRCDEDRKFRETTGITKSNLLGLAQVCYKENYIVDDPNMDTQAIVNLFAQDHYGYDGKCYTDYDALRKCLEFVNQHFKGKSVAIPYLMACHRGGGDWSVVSKMIEETLTDCDVTLYEYCGG